MGGPEMVLCFAPARCRSALGAYDSTRDNHLSNYWYKKQADRVTLKTPTTSTMYQPGGKRHHSPQRQPSVRSSTSCSLAPSLSAQHPMATPNSRPISREMSREMSSSASTGGGSRSRNIRFLTQTVPLLHGVPTNAFVEHLGLRDMAVCMLVSRAWYSHMRTQILRRVESAPMEISEYDASTMRLLLRPNVDYAHLVYQVGIDTQHYNLDWILGEPKNHGNTNNTNTTTEESSASVVPQAPPRLVTLGSWRGRCIDAHVYSPLSDGTGTTPRIMTPSTLPPLNSPRSILVCLKSGVHPLKDLIPYDRNLYIRHQRHQGKPSYSAELSYEEEDKAKIQLYHHLCATYWSLCDKVSRSEIAKQLLTNPAKDTESADPSEFDQNSKLMLALTKRQEKKFLLDRQQVELQRIRQEKISAKQRIVEEHQLEIQKKKQETWEEQHKVAALRKIKLEEVAAAAKERENARRRQVEHEIQKREEDSKKKREFESFTRTIHSTLRLSRQHKRKGDVMRQHNRNEFEKLLLVEKDRVRNDHLNAFKEKAKKAVEDMKKRVKELERRREELPPIT
eukprot:PhF_6_TR35407/c0_g1_i1/m.51529